jgi:hypothetical protein
MSKSKENTNTRLGIHMSKKSNNDEYYTPESAIKMLHLLLNDSKFPPNKKTTCWECFGSDFNYIERDTDRMQCHIQSERIII